MKNFLKPTKVTWIALVLMGLTLATIPLPFIGIPGKILFIWTVLFMPGILHMLTGGMLNEKGILFISISVISDIIFVYVTASIISWAWYKISNKNTKSDSVIGTE